MRLVKDVRDWLALRRHMRGAWSFVRTRKRPLDVPNCDVSLQAGGTLRLRASTDDRQVFNDVFARDVYGLGAATFGTVIDLGAHVGIFAVRAALVAKRVICYEPFPASHELLVENVRRFSHVTAVRRALGARRGTVELFVGELPSQNTVFPAMLEGAAAPVAVEMVALADVFEAHGVDHCSLLKIDCEGAEYDIVYGAPRDLWGRVGRVVMEYHRVPGAPASWSGEALARHFAEMGYRTRLEPRSRHPGKGILISQGA
jgi:FkbM family methyltransferase